MVPLHCAILRCDGCHTRQYLVHVPQAGLAYLIEITRNEAASLGSRGELPAQIIAALGVEVR